MGQVQSDIDSEDTVDVADSEINSRERQHTENGQQSNNNNDNNDNNNSNKRKKKKQKVTGCSSNLSSKQQQHVRKLSNVSNRNIQLLSMKPRGEKETLADDLRARRRSSLINLILGAPSSGPRFSYDLYSLSSHISNFGIEFFPSVYQVNTLSASSVRLGSIEDIEKGNSKFGHQTSEKKRRSSLGNLAEIPATQVSDNSSTGQLATSNVQKSSRKPSLASTLASIDLTSSFEQHDRSGGLPASFPFFRPPLCKSREVIQEIDSPEPIGDIKSRLNRGRVNLAGRILRRTGSELSLYSATSSTISGSLGAPKRNSASSSKSIASREPLRETKLIIILQVCLPFILAGFGNMAAGLVLHHVAQWQAFKRIPTFFVLLPSFVGMKGNIEMTLASRMSTLSNLNLLDTSYQWRKAFQSNLVLSLSQAIGLSIFAAFLSSICEFIMTDSEFSQEGALNLVKDCILVVLASALATSIILVILSSIIVNLSIMIAHYIQVNPDNLSTLIAALYGDVSCVLAYGLMANWMFSLHEQNLIELPMVIVVSALTIWPFLMYLSHQLKETRSIAFQSLGPMFISIIVSMGSGAMLSLFVNKFKLIALYQPVVNGFGANLIAVQASRVSTWLWCSALKQVPGIKADEEGGDKEEAKNRKLLGTLAVFTKPEPMKGAEAGERNWFWPLNRLTRSIGPLLRVVFWSFCNSSPNAVAAKLLLAMIVPAHTIYFLVIWLLSPTNQVLVTWQFYLVYVSLCLAQVFVLLAICEPLMTLLMRCHFDPDVFGISLLMALADLIGTVCLSGAFLLLAALDDPNAS